MSIGMDERENNFDFLRIFAAFLVVLSHSFPLSGSSYEPFAAITGGKWDFGRLGVVIFFVISGYLITKSWIEHPQIERFLWNRVLRLLPGLTVVILLSVFILGPLVSTFSITAYFAHANELIAYLENITLINISFQLPGVFTTNPYPGINGSIWTLPVEFTMYIVILLLGVIGLKKHKWFLATLTGICILLYVYTMPIGHSLAPIAGLINSIDIGKLLMPIMQNAKLTIMFLIGALYYVYKDKIIYDWRAFLTLTIIWGISSRTAYFDLASIVCVPYMILYLAQLSTKHIKNIAKHGDISYGVYIYAFPVQETIIHYFKGITPIELFIFTTPIVIILGFISWKLVESRALSLKKQSPLSILNALWSRLVIMIKNNKLRL
jgi:peptidoglycan/LPS O-acetylase OafA/YrhL